MVEKPGFDGQIHLVENYEGTSQIYMESSNEGLESQLLESNVFELEKF